MLKWSAWSWSPLLVNLNNYCFKGLVLNSIFDEDFKYFETSDKLAKVHISFENVLLLAKLNRWDWRRRCLLINVKPSNVLRPPVKEMMFDVVWSLQQRRVASSPIVFFNFCVFVFAELHQNQLQYQQNHKIRHSSSCLEPSCHHFSEKKLQLFYSSSQPSSSFFLREQLAEKSSFMGLAAGIGHTYWHFARVKTSYLGFVAVL